MIKLYHIILTLLIGIGLGVLISAYWPSNEIVVDPQINHLKEEIGWRGFKEVKLTQRIKKDSIEKIALANDVINERRRANESEAKFIEHHLNTFLKNLKPVNDSILHAGGYTTGTLKTDADKIEFLIEDTTLCDSALLRSKELVAGLTIEIVKDTQIIKTLDTLNSNLESDKNDLVKIDSLHIQTEKQLRKAACKKFFKGLGVGGVIGVILALLI